jgi:leader peptidase (prepilin peptidase)/N-methyltransferase
VETGLYLIGLGVLGLLFGSFANVVIWRFPRGESIVSPGSHCPGCGHSIRWYDNIPIVSWIALKGRCRDCRIAIPVRYPLIEALSAALWVLAGLLYGLSGRTVAAVILFYLLLILSAIDLDTMRLPNPLVGVLAAFGVVGVAITALSGYAVAPLIDGSGALSSPLLFAVLGSLAASGASLGIALAYRGVRGKAGFGMGDVKLLAALGPYLGPYTLGVLFLGSALGAGWGIYGAIVGKKDFATKFPFGPFLAAAAIIVSAVGQDVWMWYVALLGVG